VNVLIVSKHMARYDGKWSMLIVSVCLGGGVSRSIKRRKLRWPEKKSPPQINLFANQTAKIDTISIVFGLASTIKESW
jgi:hypothetical protein